MSVSRRNQGVMNLKRRLISWIKMPASGLVGAVTRGSHGPLYLLSLLATVLFLVFCLPPLLQRRKCPDNVEKYPLFVEKNGLGKYSLTRKQSSSNVSNCLDSNSLLSIASEVSWPSRAVKFVPNSLQACLNVLVIRDQRQIPSLSKAKLKDVSLLINLLPSDFNDGELKTPSHTIVAQSNFGSGSSFRPGLDLLIPESLEQEKEPYLITDLFPLKREFLIATVDEKPSAFIADILLESVTSNKTELGRAVFALLTPGDSSFANNLMLSLKSGTIPMIIRSSLGSSVAPLPLPFEETIQWDRASVRAPPQHLLQSQLDLFTELPLDEILRLKRQGQWLWKTYFSTEENILDTTLAVVRQRLGLEPPFFPETVSMNALTKKKFPETQSKPMEYLSSSREVTFRWNDAFNPWQKPPFRFTTDTRMTGQLQLKSELGWQVGKTGGRAEFTAVFMTYKRNGAVRGLLETLRGIPQLNSVVIIWNDVKSEPNLAELNLPADYPVPIRIIKSERNSINNRFLPYDVIETEAVLQIDDDKRIDREKLVLGFRIWQENPASLVGYAARTATHSDAGVYYYSWDPSCSYSIMITSALFASKYYAYRWTYDMAPVIRSNVDKYFNCEDIFQAAMVADLTQRPPIKVVNQKEFDCKTEECTGNRGISQGGGHKQKRDHCVRQMRTLFGYNPLVESTFFGDFYGNILENKETCAGFMKGN